MKHLWKALWPKGWEGILYLCAQVLIFLGLVSLPLFTLMTGMVAAQGEQIKGGEWESTMMVDEKASRTPAQKKISSDLLDRMKGKQGRTGVVPPEPRKREELQPDSTVLVDIKANVTAPLLQQIEGMGGTIINKFPKFQSIRAQVPVAQLENIAESSDVISIRSADTFQLHR